ncbi:hypothetical protein [Nocardia lijiangensis]|uniref:hypothetical protein n=1 Tax=Nocardia lijiangensis TaxID=299618 RepID=UPI003D753811
MIQLHAARVGMPTSRATVDVDMVLHIETGATTFGAARGALESLGYELRIPEQRRAPVHRFTRGIDQIDVMIADHLAPSCSPVVTGRPVFRVPAGTSALRKTVNCTIGILPDSPSNLSIPDALGALVLKGAAYKEDPRDRERHLDDAAILLCAIDMPQSDARRMSGSDRGRVRTLAQHLSDSQHRSWLTVPPTYRMQGQIALSILARDPEPSRKPRRLGTS